MEWRKALPNAALAAFTVVLFCGFAEAALRVRFARSLDFSMEMWKYAVALKQPVANPRLSFAHRPNSAAFLMGADFRINSTGHRDREFTREKPAGVFRIVWLGDSTTVGWGVRMEDTAPKILERNLNATGTGMFEVINAGVGNYGTVQEVEHYLTIDRAFRPDAVILEYFINDAEPVPQERNAGLLGHSYLAAFAVSRFDGALRLTGRRPGWREYYASLYREGAPGLEAAKDALGRLVDATTQDKTPLLVAVLPELHQINSGYPFEQEQRKIETYLDSRNTPVLDLLPSLRNHGAEETLWVTTADDHPNAKANTLIAAAVQQAMVARGQLPATR